MRGFISSLGSDQVRYTHHVHQAQQAPAISPAGWLASLLLFGIPALTFALLFHCAGPNLFVGAAIDVRSASRNALTQRLRLSFPSATAWISAVALSGFMYGGNWEDIFAVAASWLALWKGNNRRVWAFAAILIATFRQKVSFNQLCSHQILRCFWVLPRVFRSFRS